MIRRPPRSTQSRSSAASDVYKRQGEGSNQMGLHARLMSYALRRLTAAISKSNTTVIFINQLRAQISTGYGAGPTETTTGGRALKFYSSVRIEVKRGKQITQGENVIGHELWIKVVKNKLAPPFKQAEFDIIFGEGISKIGEIIDLGADLEIIQKSGSWYSYDNNKLGQGREQVKKLLLDNPDLANQIESKIREKLAQNA